MGVVQRSRARMYPASSRLHMELTIYIYIYTYIHHSFAHILQAPKSRGFIAWFCGSSENPRKECGVFANTPQRAPDKNFTLGIFATRGCPAPYSMGTPTPHGYGWVGGGGLHRRTPQQLSSHMRPKSASCVSVVFAEGFSSGGPHV